MDKNIAEMVNSSKVCALAAKVPTVTCKTWPKRPSRGKGFTSTSQVLWMSSTTSLSSTAALNGWMFKNAEKPITNCPIGSLHELFACFGVVDSVVTDNATQFTSNELEQFCDTYQVKHITTQQYHPRSK